MRWVAMALACVLSPWGATVLARPISSDHFQITAVAASTWSNSQGNIIQLTGPVKIQLDQATLSADAAVIWLSPVQGAAVPMQDAQIALIGHAAVVQGTVTRSGDQLLVSARARDGISLSAGQRVAQDAADTPLYHQALALRSMNHMLLTSEPTGENGTSPVTTGPSTTRAVTSAPALPHAVTPIAMRFNGTLQQVKTDQGKIAVVIDGGVLLMQKRPDGDFLELRADRVVLFTTLSSLNEARTRKVHKVENAVDSVYLEGDVRIEFTPHDARHPQQRLEANRVYYDFQTDQAVLSDAVVHTVEPRLQIPIILRAQRVRQLAQGQYDATKAVITTSAFATPTYSIAASTINVRQSESEDEDQITRTTFTAHDATFNALDVPVFYFPAVGGTLTQRGFPLRRIAVSNSTQFGTGIQTTWGVLETLGLVRPRGLDLSARVDYFSKRGPALGLDGKYSGGFITPTTHEPWNFTGDLHTYFVRDTGVDDLGRGDVDPDRTVRGAFLWEHQHFFPDNWQLQTRIGYVTDPTFLEQWLPNQFDNGLPHDLSLYVKRQDNTEATTFLVNAQPRDFVTTADALQNQFEVEHLPEFGYHRIGDSFADDTFTFFSDDTLSRLRYHASNVPLSDMGFAPGVSPGLPSLGTTGTTESAIYRGNFRQEVDYPLGLGPVRMVPYVQAIYTGYSNSPTGQPQNRIYSGAGIRATTAFWKVDESAQSDLFDIHRLRHVIEPEINLFTSGMNVEQDNVYVFDPQTDAINDISAMQLALHQRWQTKRGGPGRWRSVDLFTWNIEGNFFANQPPDALLQPLGFRGLYFPSLPEASIPRNGVNSDFTWRVSDTTALLGDTAYNLDESQWATAAIGLAVRHDPRLSYYLGTRYINELNSNITTFAVNYELTKKYSLAFSQSFDFAQQDDVGTNLTITRRFDRFFLSVGIYHNSIDNTSGITFNLIPEGMPGRMLNNIQNVFAGR